MGLGRIGDGSGLWFAMTFEGFRMTYICTKTARKKTMLVH